MDFKLNEKTGNWEGSASVRGRVVELAIDKSYPEQALTQLGSAVVKRIADHWEEIQRNLADSLLETQFLGKIILDSIRLMEENSITLYFGDSDIFGGHLVDVFWTTEKMYPATLVG